jgi:hypothetical protein
MLRVEIVNVRCGQAIRILWFTPAIPATPARGTMGKTGVKTGVIKPSLLKDFY